MLDDLPMDKILTIAHHHANALGYIGLFDTEKKIIDGSVGVEIGYGRKGERRDKVTGEESKMISLGLYGTKLSSGDILERTYLFNTPEDAITALIKWENKVLELVCELDVEEQLAELREEFETEIFAGGFSRLFQGHLDEEIYS